MISSIPRVIFYFLLFSPLSSLWGQMTLQKALAEVKKYHTFFYVYDPQWANVSVHASTHLSAPIHVQLEEILANTPLTFQRTGNAVYVISKRSKAQVPEKIAPKFIERYAYQIRILDKDSSFALPETCIMGNNFSVFSDSTGYASFLSPHTNVPIWIKRLGYEAVFVQLTHQQPDTTIFLTSQTNELSEVKVISNGVDFLTSFSHMKVNEVQPRQIPGQPFGSDVFYLLRLIPGVSPVVEPSNGVYVRGATPNQTLIMYDQIQLIQPEHFLTTSGFVPSEQIGSISLDKSFIPARYGGRLAALLTLESKTQNEVKNQLILSVGLFQSRATWEYIFGRKWSVVASAQKSIPSPVLTRLGNHLVYHRTLAPPNEITQKIAFYDGTTTINYQPSTHFTMKWTYFQSSDYFESKPRSSSVLLLGNFIRWQSRGASWQLDKKWSAHHQMYWKASLSLNKQIVQNQQIGLDSSGQVENGLAALTGMNDFSAKNRLSEIELVHQFTLPSFQLKSGIQGQFYSSQFILSTSMGGLGNRATTLMSPVLYSDAQWDISSHWMFDAGIRISRLPFSDATILEPRLQLKVKNENWSSNLFFTQQSQALIKIAMQTVPSHFNGVWVLADGKDIQVAQAGMSGFNSQWKFRKGAAVFHVFYKWQDHLTEFIPKFRSNTVSMFDVGKSQGWGVEIAFKWHTKFIKNQLDYTWNHTRFAFPIISNGKWFRAPYIPQHEWKSWHAFTWKRWSFSSTFVFAIQRPFILELLEADTPRNVNAMEYNTSSLSPYHRVDLGLSYRPSPSFSIDFSVQNVYNRKNEWYRVRGDFGVHSVYQFGCIPSFQLVYRLH